MTRGGICYCAELLDLVVCSMCGERRHMYFKIEEKKQGHQPNMEGLPNANPCEKPSGMWLLHSEMVCCHIWTGTTLNAWILKEVQPISCDQLL